MDIASLPCGLWQNLRNRLLEAGVVVGDDELDPM
jgi:hypothetical protein